MSILRDVLKLAKTGKKIFPVRADAKIPHIRDWHNNATADPAQIRSWWKKWPEARVGMPTGVVNGLWVVDIDVKNGKDGEATLNDLPELLCNLEQTTMSGGRHLFFAHKDHYSIKSRVNVLGEGVDVRCDGGYVLVAPTDGYTLTQGDFETELREAPQWCIDMVSKKINKAGPNGKSIRLTEKEIIKNLSNCPIECYRDRDSWRNMIMSVKSASGGEDYGLKALMTWSSQDSDFHEDDTDLECTKVWNSTEVDKDDGVTGKSLVKQANAHSAIEKSKTAFEGLTDVTATESGSADAWQFNKGDVKELNSSDRNIYCLVLQPEFRMTASSPSQPNPLFGMVGYDELKGQTVFMKPPMWIKDKKKAESLVGETITDNMMHNFMIAAQYMTNVNFPFARFYSGIVGASMENRFHPVKEYLKSLEWDGVPRVDTWIQDYLGVKPELENTSYLRAISRVTLLGGVHRAFEPGCVMQTMLILESERQGVGKSEAVKILGKQWFFEPHFDIGSKDAEQNLQGTWVNEWGELSNLSKKGTDELKDFLTKTRAHLRKSHDRAPSTLLRGCIIIGTTNKESGAGYLKDPTGARRFLPVEIIGKVKVTHNGVTSILIDRDAFLRDVDQIWAEATHRFLKGENTKLMVDEIAEAKIHQSDRSVRDGREDPLADWLFTGEAMHEDVVTSVQVATRCFQVRPDEAKGYKLREYHHMMLTLGWKHGQHKNESGHRVRAFKRPKNWDPYAEDEDNDDVTLE